MPLYCSIKIDNKHLGIASNGAEIKGTLHHEKIDKINAEKLLQMNTYPQPSDELKRKISFEGATCFIYTYKVRASSARLILEVGVPSESPNPRK